MSAKCKLQLRFYKIIRFSNKIFYTKFKEADFNIWKEKPNFSKNSFFFTQVWDGILKSWHTDKDGLQKTIMETCGFFFLVNDDIV